MRLTLGFAPLIVLGAVVAQQQDQLDRQHKLNAPAPVTTPDYKGMTMQPEPYVKPQATRPAVNPVAGDKAKTTASKYLAAAFDNPDFVAVDHPGDGKTWVMGHNYKACFSADGTVFAPVITAAPKYFPVTFGMPQITVAGRALRSGGTSLSDSNHVVTFERGDFKETWQLMGKGIEQKFVFDRLAARGSMVVTVPFTTELAGQRNGDGIEFTNQFGAVGYSQAVAIDANGNRLALSTELRGSSIEITVPAAFVETAQLPLVIDPLVGATVYASPGGVAPVAEGLADIAYDDTNSEYVVTYQRFLNATDTDVWAQRMTGAAFALSGAAIAIDLTFDVWENSKIANNNLADNYLVVAQVSVDGASPFWIAGRTLAAGTGVMGTQFDIEKAGVASHLSGDKINPDVGGDPLLVGPTYYTVVWERVFSATDHDIHMKQVLAAGTLRTAAPVVIENSGTDNDSNPSISKSDGVSPASSQNWAITFERFYTTADQDIRGSIVNWNGVILQTGTPLANSFSVDFSATKDVNPSPSSPTDVSGGQRYVLFSYESQPNGGGQGAICGTVFSVLGVPRSGRTDLNVLEGATAAEQAFPQSRPSADSDGCRFIVAYDEFYNAGGVDQDVRISLFSFQAAPGNAGALFLNEARYTAGYSTSVEIQAEITSVHSSGGAMTRYAAAWTDLLGTGNDRVEGILMDGYRPSTIVSRATGCGTLTAAATNNRLGETMVLTLTGATGFAGFVFGAPQPGVPLPPCPSCQVGVAGGATLTGNPQNIYLPCHLGALVGATYAVQGFDFSTGPCLGQIKLSNTLDITIQ